MTMRHWLMGLGVMLVALGAISETPITVMTFNLRYGTAPDGENSWQYRKDILVNTIKEAAPDILGTQECLQMQAEYIAASLPDYQWFGIGREEDGGGEMAAIFYKKSVLNPIEAGNFWLSETPDVPGSKSWGTACTRIVTWIRFWHRQTKTFFYHYNTHLDHESELARQNGALLIGDRIGKLPQETPVILTGDFNCIAVSAKPWVILTACGLIDTRIEAARKEGPEGSFCGFGPPTPDCAKERIDWILVRGNYSASVSTTVVHEENNHYPSDHFPVVVQLTLK